MRDPGPVCAHLLDVATDALTDPPERRMVLHAPPAFDQDQLTVHVLPINVGRPGAPQTTVPVNACDLPIVITYVITLLRYYPMVDADTDFIPTVDDEQPVVLDLYTDGTALWNAMDAEVSQALSEAGHQLGNLGAVLGPLEPIAPQGGLAGWTLQVTGT